MAHAETDARHPEFNTARKTNRPAWSGTDSFGDAMKLAREGWEKGRKEAEKKRAAFAALLGNKVRRPVLAHAVAGFSPDVGAYLAGEPECMFTRETIETEAHGKIVRLVVNGALSASVSESTLLTRGAFVCALAEALECAGYSVEIEVLSVWQDHAGSAKHFLSFPLKRSDEMLEVDRLAFVSGHVSFARRLLFSAMEQDADLIRSGALHYYGMPTEAPKARQGDVYFGRMFTGEMESAALVGWVKKQLAPLGIEFSE